MIWGKLLPAARSLELSALPIGLAKGLILRSEVAAGSILTRDDVMLDLDTPAYACPFGDGV